MDIVLITTKKGKSGKTRFQLGYSYGTGRVHSFLELMDTSQYLQMRKEAYNQAKKINVITREERLRRMGNNR